MLEVSQIKFQQQLKRLQIASYMIYQMTMTTLTKTLKTIEQNPPLPEVH